MARVSSSTSPRRRGGFSLIELVIVVVIIGIIAAIAIPRMSRGTAGAADSAAAGNLQILRNAVEMYASEHGGDFPTGAAAADVEKQLTSYTDVAGVSNASGTRDTATGKIYGPYLRKMPPAEVGTLKGKAVNNKIVLGTTAEATPTGGWLYDTATGSVKINLVATEKDSSNKSYFTDY